MAKWGEGDPRWLVEHREDGRNVNNWHWQELNKMEWSKRRLAELLPGTRVEGAGGPISVTKVMSVTGEAMLTTRKGNKRFAFYDLKLALAWEAGPAPAAGGNGAAGSDAAAAGAEDGGAAAAEGGEAAGEAGAEPAAAEAPEPAASGEISVAEFGSGSDHEDLELSVTCTGGSASSADKEAARRRAQEALWPAVLERLEQFVRELSEL